MLENPFIGIINMINIYKNKCAICKAPAMNTICSNYKCKSWKKYRSMASGCKVVEHGLTSNDPITIYCSICNTHLSTVYGLDGALVHCKKCKKYSSYNFINDRWYNSSNHYSIRYINKIKLWDLNVIIDTP